MPDTGLPLQHSAYEASADVPNVVVDGSPNEGTVLVLSHWPGMPAPPGCEADTSCQMVFRYLDRGADLHGEARVVTNNHFDQDGLAGIYVLVDPEGALRRRSLVEGLALAGDFGVAPDRPAARLSMAVAALSDPDRTPLGVLPEAYGERCTLLYEEGLRLLPGWLDDPESCRELWAEEDAELDAAETLVASGAVRIEEHPEVDLAVVTLPAGHRSAGHRFAHHRFTGIQPIALHAATDRSVLLLVDPADGRHRVTWRYEGWVQFRTRRIRPRVAPAPLAAELDALETGAARWAAGGPGDLSPEAAVDAGPGSSIDGDQLVRVVARYLAAAPPAWDPYRVAD